MKPKEFAATTEDCSIVPLATTMEEKFLPYKIDLGPEFTSKSLDQWAYDHRVELKLIQPGKPTHMVLLKALGRFRDKCLNEHWFRDLAHAREIIGNWRRNYNENRPHSALATRPHWSLLQATGLWVMVTSQRGTSHQN